MTILHTYPDIAGEFHAFVAETSAPGSNRPSSYVQAIHILNMVLNGRCPEVLGHTHNLWLMTDPTQLEAIRQRVLVETKKPDGGIFAGVEPKSYWRNNYCSAALGELRQFQQLAVRKNGICILAERSRDPVELAKELEKFDFRIDPGQKDEQGITLDDLEGKDRLVMQKARENQHKFRTLVLWNYDNQCCISGLPIVPSLQASHISDWSHDAAMRLNATNGLCLAAHYHLAFDNHLITLDEQYRLVISRTLQDYVTNEAFREQFQRYEGQMIRMPRRYNPAQELLAKHRELLAV